MQKTSEEKLRKQVLGNLKPLIDGLVVEGMDRDRIVSICKRHTDGKLRQFYKVKEPGKLGGAGLLLHKIKKIKNDSKAEAIFFQLLTESDIKFKFQYAIGPYTADYLVGSDLVVELDGPQHKIQKEHDDKRDKYLNKMGYRVLRIPLEIVALDPSAVMNEIKALENGSVGK